MKNFIIDNLLNKNNYAIIARVKKNGDWVKKYHQNEYLEILEITNFIKEENFSRRIYHIYNDLLYIPGCLSCENKVTFLDFSRGYRKFCSATCNVNHPTTKQKHKQTCLEKYGVEHSTQAEKVKQKHKQTCLEKYGVDNASKADSAKEKVKNTCLEKYGVDHILKVEEVKNAIKQTCLEKYGVDNPYKAKEVKNKIKQTNIERYGCSIPLNNEIILKKYKNTIMERRKINLWPRLIKSIEEKNYKLLTEIKNFHYMIKFICDNGHITETHIGNWFRDLGCNKCSGRGTSIGEKDVFAFISDNIHAINGIKKIIPPYQLDIFIKECNLAIEYNGVYWHSERLGTPKDYHLNKTNLCKDQGIDLVHLFEDEWIYKQDIVKSMLLNKLGKIENRIYARKCIVKEIDSKTKDEFLNSNHIQGTCVSSVNLGLFYEEELVSVMTLGKRSITGQKPKNEMLRFCNKLNTSVIGSAGRLFKHYVIVYRPLEVISYADKRWFSGKMYETLGFELDHESSPNYWYVVNGRREHRAKYQKHKLHKLLENFDVTKTEWQNMQDHGYDRIWDCGNMVYKWENK